MLFKLYEGEKHFLSYFVHVLIIINYHYGQRQYYNYHFYEHSPSSGCALSCLLLSDPVWYDRSYSALPRGSTSHCRERCQVHGNKTCSIMNTRIMSVSSCHPYQQMSAALILSLSVHQFTVMLPLLLYLGKQKIL